MVQEPDDAATTVTLGQQGDNFKGPLDAELQLMNAAAPDAGGASAVIDMGEGFAPAPAQPLGVVVQPSALVLTADTGICLVEVEESADGLSYTKTGLSFTLVDTSPVYKVFGLCQRYVRLLFTLTGASTTVTANAWLVRV